MAADWTAQLPFFVGLVLGLSLAAPPGPMNALIAQESARGGWIHGVRIGVAAPIVDTFFLILFALGVAPLLAGQNGILRLLAGMGAVLMAWFSYQAWTVKAATPPAAGFAKAFVLAITNPYQVTWWLTVGIVTANDLGPAWVVGFMLGIFGWVVIFSGLVAKGARKWAWFTGTVAIASAVLLALFAIVMAGYALGFSLLG